MRRLLFRTAAGLCLAALAGLGSAAQAGDKLLPDKPNLTDKDPDKHAKCGGSFGTSVEFVSTPTEAAKQAKKEQKLLFVLHVSGNFEDPRFT